MAVLTATLDRGVKLARFLQVAPGAGRRRRNAFATVRLVTARALLMADRGRGELLRVASAAERWLDRLVGRWPVTRGTFAVAAIFGSVRRFDGVTAGAELATSDGGKAVGLMAVRAIEARSMNAVIARRDLGVARRAKGGLHVHVARMGRMARDARLLSVVHHVHLRVAPLARSSRLLRCMRLVAARALGVNRRRRGDERRFDAVTAHAHASRLGDEVMRLVAGEARVVVRRLRPGRPLVARSARLQRRFRRLVRAVAILATLALGMGGVRKGPFVVARCAVLRRDGRRGVWVMAIVALDGCVLRHPGMRPLRLRMAAETCRGRLRGEGVARETPGRMLPARMRVRRLCTVAAGAHARPWVREAARFETVAVPADHRPFPDVLLVPCTRTKLGPRRRNDLRRGRLRPLRNDAKESEKTAGNEKEHGGDETEDRLPRRGHHPPP